MKIHTMRICLDDLGIVYTTGGSNGLACAGKLWGYFPGCKSARLVDVDIYNEDPGCPAALPICHYLHTYNDDGDVLVFIEGVEVCIFERLRFVMSSLVDESPIGGRYVWVVATPWRNE